VKGHKAKQTQLKGCTSQCSTQNFLKASVAVYYVSLWPVYNGISAHHPLHT